MTGLMKKKKPQERIFTELDVIDIALRDETSSLAQLKRLTSELGVLQKQACSLLVEPERTDLIEGMNLTWEEVRDLSIAGIEHDSLQIPVMLFKRH